LLVLINPEFMQVFSSNNQLIRATPGSSCTVKTWKNQGSLF